MAKFANVTYGTQGKSEQYTYVVNDNVRVGDWLHPSVKHYRSGKIYGTTAITQSTSNSLESALDKSNEYDGKDSQLSQDEVAGAFTGREVGAKPERTAQGTFREVGAMGKTVKGEEGLRVAAEGKEFTRTQYIEQVREANVAARETGETFDTYSSKFTKRGENP